MSGHTRLLTTVSKDEMLAMVGAFAAALPSWYNEIMAAAAT